MTCVMTQGLDFSSEVGLVLVPSEEGLSGQNDVKE